jgi:hypothetical protein
MRSASEGIAMLARLASVLVLSVLLIAPRPAGALPITFDFAGTLSTPINGATTFTGSTTINGDPTITNPNGFEGLSVNAMAAESGSDVSITVNVGGQVYTFANSPQNPSTQATFNAFNILQGIGNPNGTPTVESMWKGSVQSGGNVQQSFGMNFYDTNSNGVASLRNLRNMTFPPDTSSVNLQVTSGGV